MDPIYKLECVTNFRDVGHTVNKFLGERRMREGLFFRSSKLDDATTHDHRVLRDEIGIRAVIDLRTDSERLKQARRHERRVAAVGPDAVEPLQIQGLEYHHVKVTGRPFEKNLLRRLSWWSYIKFFALYLLGYRMPAISIIGEEVMTPLGLLGLGCDTMDCSGPQVREALMLYASPKTLPSLVHCTHGKDRTGLISALILMILDIPQAAIENDYFLTDVAVELEREKREREMREVGLPASWAGTIDNMISGIIKHMDDRYGGLNSYLDHIGFAEDDRNMVRETLLY